MFTRSTDRLRAASLAVCGLAGSSCGHDAWLGMQCPTSDVRCDELNIAAVGGSTGLEAGQSMERVTEMAPATESEPGPAGNDAGPSTGTDAHDQDSDTDAATAGSCRTVTINYFACASGNETPGAPRLLAGRAYTLRFRGTYALDTTLLLTGATAACMSTMLGTLTLVAGEPAVERCLEPSEDVALLLGVTSGTPEVWAQNGLNVEVCEGCKS